MRHLMSPLDFSVEELDQLLDLASDIEKHPEIIRMVSETLSPLAAELLSAEEKPKILPPRFIMAASKLRRVRVLGS